jgi:radical SAM superfamily enzyme YgiQ (UPF0313 family)
MEPLGVTLLSAIAKQAGHESDLSILAHDDFCARVSKFDPDVVAYSVTSSEIELVKKADDLLRRQIKGSGRKVHRIMGGPLPTSFPGILDEMGLDSICQGDGDRAFPELLRRLEAGDSIEGIPNIALTSAGARKREMLHDADLDALPFADRGLYFRAVPFAQPTGLRSFTTSRGCPYSCAYCYNDAYNKMFRGLGPIVRRSSVDRVLSEIEYNIREFPPVKYIRFFDYIFCTKKDAWLEEFAEKYPSRIGLPFYCLMHPSAWKEDVAKLLAQAGCASVSMSVDSGSQSVRRDILGRRDLSDQDMAEVWQLARKYRIRTFSNTIVGIPGTASEDDLVSLDFTRSLRITVPMFSVYSPSRGTRLTEFAQERGILDKEADMIIDFTARSPLNCYSAWHTLARFIAWSRGSLFHSCGPSLSIDFCPTRLLLG